MKTAATTREQTMTETADTKRIRRTIAGSIAIVERIDFAVAAGETLTQARADARHAAENRACRYTAWLLDIAEKAGEDFVSIDLGWYTENHALENGRWEAFATFPPIDDGPSILDRLVDAPASVRVFVKE